MPYQLAQRVQSASKPDLKGSISEILAPVGARTEVYYRVTYDGGFQDTFPENGLDPEGTPEVWRDDKLSPPHALASVNFNIIHAEDLVGSLGMFTLVLAHVSSFHGKGFKPIVRNPGGGWTGEVFLGVSSLCHERAVAAGKAMLESEHKRVEQEVEQLKQEKVPS
jgi:hypothetical protein